MQWKEDVVFIRQTHKSELNTCERFKSIKGSLAAFKHGTPEDTKLYLFFFFDEKNSFDFHSTVLP